MPKLNLIYKTGTTPFFPISLVAINYSLPFRESFGINDCFSYILFVAEERSYNWFLLDSDIKRLGEKINRQILRNGEKYLRTCEKKASETEKEMLDLVKNIKTPGKEINWDNDKRVKFFKNLFPLYKKYGYYTDTVSFAMQINGLVFFQKQLYPYLKKASEQQKEYIFNLLTCYTENTYTKKSDIELLKIALLSSGEQKKKIKKHTEKYYWLQYDYFGPILDEQYFRKRMLKLKIKKTHSRIEQQIQKWQIDPREKNKEIKETITEYKINEKLVKAFAVIRDFAYFYSETKKSVLNIVNIAIRNVLTPLATERGLDLINLYFLTEKEILDFIQRKEIAEINSRKDHGVLLGQQEYKFLQGEEEKKYLEKIQKFIYQEGVREINGQTACPGKARGRVQLVLNASQIQKITRGDILVAPFTTVSYVPAMEKARAIVTDLGGITSHAAIVSRELKIPCVIGTKIATQVFHDGDLVEVDADRGIIKKIK